MSKFAKQILFLGSGDNSFQTDMGHDFEGEFEMDNIAGTLSFNLPYKGDNIKILKKYDTVMLYFGYFDTDPGDVVVNPELDIDGNMYRVFNGYVNKITLKKGKTSFTFGINAIGSMGLCNIRNTTINVHTTSNPTEAVNTVLQMGGLQDGAIARDMNIEVFNEIIPASNIIEKLYSDETDLNITIKGGNNMKEIFDDLKRKYGLIIHQRGDGKVIVSTPFNMSTSPDDENGWEFRLDENIFELNYNDLTTDINSVVVLGQSNTMGMAIDPVALQYAAGDREVQQSDYRYEVFENRDLISDIDCEKVARNKLLEIAKSHYINFKTLFDPRFTIGQRIKIYDYDKLDGRVFIIKNIYFTISKSDISCDITAYIHSLQQLPEDLVLRNAGIADLAVVDLDKEVIDAVAWNEGLTE